MTNEQIVEKIRNGYSAATDYMQLLYENNLPLIKMFIKPYVAYECADDLLQEAYFGLWQAVQHYESSENASFMTYAKFWIVQSVRQYLEKCGSIVRIPSYTRQKIRRYRKAIQELEQDLGRAPTDKEISDKMRVSVGLLPPDELDDLKRYALYNDMWSIDSHIDESSGENTLQDYIASPDNVEESVVDVIYRREMQEAVREAMEIALTEQERDTIKAYYWNNETLAIIADHKGITKGRVQQQLAQAQQKLSRGRSRKILKDYAEIESKRYVGGLSFFKQHGSIVEYEVLRKEEALHDTRKWYEDIKRRGQERFEKRVAELMAI